MINIDTHVANTVALLALASAGFIFVRYQTVLFGFTFFAFWNIASASLAGFLFDSAFGLGGAWITPIHRYVVFYSSIGVMLFALGAFIAWRPLGTRNNFLISTITNVRWLNTRFVSMCFVVGAIAQLFYSIAFRIPTVQAAWSAYFEFPKLGILILLLHCQVHRKSILFLVGFLIFVVMGLFQAVLSGHIGAIGTFSLQLLAVGCFWRRVQPRSTVIFCGGILLLTLLMVGWLSSRSIIRSGELNSSGMIGRSTEFVERFDYVDPRTISPHILQDYILLRFDMTSILTAQVYQQPVNVPFALGATVYRDLLAALVPRILWPNKPVKLGGSQFVSHYTGLSWGEETSVGLPYQFELYANGGAIAVSLGLLFLGWLTAKLELSLVVGNYSMPKFLAMFIIVNGITAGSQTIVALIMQLISGYIATFVLGRLLQKFDAKWHFWGSSSSAPSSNRRAAYNYPVRPSVRVNS